MAMKVRIGIGPIPVEGTQPGVGTELAELVDELEATRIDSMWQADVVSAKRTIDPLIGLAYAAGRTERLKLGTAALVLPGRNPALVAAQLAGLAALAPGRVLPSFGMRIVQPATRSMFPVPDGRRAEMLEEALVMIRALLTQPAVTHHGEFFHLDEASVAPLPATPLDLWLGGRAPVGMRRVGRLADGWLGSFITPDEAVACRGQIERAAAGAGREIEADHYGTNLLMVRDDCDPTELAKALATTHQHRPDLDDPERLVYCGWAAVRAEINRFIDAGLTKFIVRSVIPVTALRDFLDQFSTELLALQT
jgi:probable F420-dependent oxidoreductase